MSEVKLEQIQKGQLWNKPKTEEMLEYESKRTIKAVTGDNRITGQFIRWLYAQKNNRSTPCDICGEVFWSRGGMIIHRQWHNPKFREKLRRCGEKGRNWKGDNIGYAALHNWVRKNKLKPEFCDICGLPENYNDNLGKLELSNKTGKLIRNLNNFQYIHYSCHRKYDKENEIVHEGLLT